MFRRSALTLYQKQCSSVRTLEAIPVIGAPLAAYSNAETHEELKELSANNADAATAVSERFAYHQKKLIAYRLHLIRQQWSEFTYNPFALDGVTPIIFARTLFLSVILYALGFYLGAGFGVELPVVGILVGGEEDKAPTPADLPWNKKN
eukprot:Rhum_TRINITY_DN20670_c0_g1::Rhum_TRINITY_DN20670_c0_g1_i1::g.171762::m.171762